MRVISGTARGLKLTSPKNDDVRPTTDRVKESLFNIINNYVIDSDVLDLFSGTGSLGIECLSRHANSAVFVDLSKESIQVINENIKKARVLEKSTVLNLDYIGAINKLKVQNKQFDIIFMDPPYYKEMFEPALQKINETKLLKEDGIIITEHDTKTNLPETVGNITKEKSKKYGNTTLSFYKWEE